VQRVSHTHAITHLRKFKPRRWAADAANRAGSAAHYDFDAGFLPGAGGGT
jgi:hypothetical protein